MKRKLLLLGLTALFVGLVQQLAAQNSCATATAITSNGLITAPGPSTGAGCYNCGGGAANANWYSWTAPSNGVIDVSACSLSATDTRLWIYSGSCAGLTQVAADDDACTSSDGFASAVTGLMVTNGTTYYLEWDDRWSSTTFQFNFTFTAISCLAPGALGVTNLTAGSADLNWTSGGAANWNVEYGPTGFTLGTGTKLNATNDTTSISGLSANTTYQFYVRDSCGVGDVSTYAGPYSFTTACLAVAVFPWIEDFETSTTSIPACWQNETGDDDDWIFRSGSIGHGATVDHTLGTSAGYYAGMDDSHSSANDTINNLLTPSFDLTALTVPRLKFYYYIGDDATLTSRLIIDVYDGTSWNLGVATISYTQEAWLEFLLDLTPYKSSTTRIRFRGIETTDFNSDVSIDDVTVEETPACPAPSALAVQTVTPGSATVYWTSGGAASWNVQYGPQGFSLGSGTVMGEANDTTTLAGLSQLTMYDFYVQDNCGTDSSVWVGPVSFMTTCGTTLSGTYTVNNTVATGGTNYASFSELAFTLAHCGVSGAVTVNVKEGTYNEQVLFDTIPGASALNTVTIQADITNTNPVILTYGASGSSDNYVVLFDNTDYIALKGLTLTATGSSYTRVVQIDGSSSHLIIEDNILNGAVSTSTSTNYAVVYNSSGSAHMSHNCQLINNTINNGSYAVYWYGSSSTSFETNNTISGNTIDGFYYYGLAFQYQDGGVIDSNIITSNASSSATVYGISNYYSDNSTVTRNKVVVRGTSTNYGIYNYYNDASSTTPNLITNNMVTCEVSSGTTYGIYPFNNYYTDVVYNSVNVTSGSTTAGRGIYLNSSTTGTYGFVNLKNNNVVNSGGGYAVEVSSGAVTLGYVATSDYNNAYATGATVVRVNNSNYADLSAYQTAVPTFDQNSVSVDPLFTGTTDLHAASPGINNMGSPYAAITVDIDNEARSGTTPDIGADEFTPPSCVPSSGLTVVTVFADSAIVSWTPGGGTTFNLEYDTLGYTQGAGISITGITDTFYTITGLTPLTSYSFYIQDDCGGGNGTSMWTGPVSFTTACAPVSSFPWTEDFETSQSSIPVCWENETGDNDDWIFRSGSIGHGATTDNTTGTSSGYYAGMDDSHSSTTDTVNNLLTPSFDLTGLTAPRLAFYHFIGNDATLTSRLIIDVYDGTTWNLAVSTVTFTQAAWLQHFVDLTPYKSAFTRVRFRGVETTDFNSDVSIDDISVAEAPNCIAPTALGATNITSSTADVYWTGGGAANWRIEYDTTGFTFGSGTRMSVTNDTVTLSGLLPTGTYSFYVQDSCGAGNVSAWSGPYTFTTNFGVSCVTGNSSALFSEEFDVVGNWTGNISASSTSNGQWIFPHSGTTTSTSTGPTGAYSGSNYTYVETSGNNGDTASMVSPPIDLTSGIGQAALGFYLHAYGADIATLKIGVSNSATGPFTNVYTHTGAIQTANADPFVLQSANLNAYIGQVIYLEVSYYGWAGFNGDLAIDKLEVVSCVTCVSPSNLAVSNTTSSSADFSWTTGGAANWEIEYGPVGYVPGTGTRQAVTSGSSATLSGLSANTNYDVFVRDSCGAGDVSAWHGPLSFTTLCASQLAGVYTINSALPTVGTNFTSVADAIAELNDCGVSGQVTFDVAANSGPYTGGLEILDVIGISATDSVVFNGNGNVLTTGTAPHVLRISGTSYVTINDFQITNADPTTPAFGIMIADASQHLNITNNTIDMGQGYTSSLSGCIVASGSATSATTAGNNAQYLNIRNNELIGGYYGITLLGNSSYLDNYGHTIADNIVRDFYLYGIYISNGDTITVRDNDINRATRTTVSTFYGVYMSTARNIKVIANRIHDSNTGAGGSSTCYPIYMTTSVNSLGYETELINNAIYNINPSSSTIYGIYMLGTRSYVNMYHNTVEIDVPVSSSGTVRAVFSSGAPDNYNVRNNIFSVRGAGTGTKHAIYVSTTSTSFSANNNVYFMGATAGTNSIGYWGADQALLSDWQTATGGDASSVSVDPVLANPPAGDVTPLSGTIDNIGTSVGVLTDIDGTTRSLTTPDVGAVEFSGLSADLALTDGRLVSGQCPTSNDSVYLKIDNVIGNAVDFSVNPLTAVWNVSGPISSSGTIVVSSGTLAASASMEIGDNGMDFSQPGTYTLNAYIQGNASNSSALNDTLLATITIDILPLLAIDPKADTIVNSFDSVTLRASSPLFPAGDFMITEICHFKTATGAPTLGWPAYLTADDYIEITGAPNSDLEGITLEQWSTTALQTSYTFPAGTKLSPNGTAIIQIGAGAGVSSPADFYYNGIGTASASYSSSTAAGRILKDANGNIVDAVGYNNYSFPAAANVPASEWSSPLSGGGSTSGIRLEGADNNTGSTWVVSSSTSPQDPNVLNTNVTLPAPPLVSGFSWSYLGSSFDTTLVTNVGPYTSSGTYQYVATYNSACGIITDTATIVVNLPACQAPVALGVDSTSRTSADVYWTAGGAANWNIEYGPIGFTPGSGTMVNSTNDTLSITGLTSNLVYQFYVRDSCGLGNVSAWTGPFTFGPATTPCDNFDSYATGLIDPQSYLINGWAGAGGDALISTDYASSGTKSLKIHTSGTPNFSDVVAVVGPYTSGVWNMAVDVYIPATNGGYYNILHNYVSAGTNVWAIEVTLDANGTATVAEGTNGTGTIGTFSYTPAAWNTIEHIIDLDNDTAYIMVNGVATIGWQFSLGSTNFGGQFNAMNFYSTAPTGQTPLIYFDDFCVSPYVIGPCTNTAGADSSGAVCGNNAMVDLSTYLSGADPNGTWVDLDASGALTGTMFNASQVAAGVGYDFAYYVSAAGCPNDSAIITINVAALPDAGPNVADTVCDTIISIDLVSYHGANVTPGGSWVDVSGSGALTGSIFNPSLVSFGSNYVFRYVVSDSCGTDSSTVTLYVDDCKIGLREYKALAMDLYPNPSKGLVYISSKSFAAQPVSIEVYSASGQLLLQIRTTLEPELTLDLSKLADGMYNIKIATEDHTEVHRISKM